MNSFKKNSTICRATRAGQRMRPEATFRNATIDQDDLPQSQIGLAKRAQCAALDLETSGLDWSTSVVATCQVFVPGSEVHIVQLNGHRPQAILAILADPTITKVFHHAVFDLRFIIHHWAAEVRNVACTKIASKILEPKSSDHSLQSLVHRYLQASLCKQEQTSNWLAKSLSPNQIEYAAKDVVFLPELLRLLKERLQRVKRWEWALASFEYVPVRARLDLCGSGDVFTY